MFVLIGAVIEHLIPLFESQGHSDATSWISPIVLIVVSILIFIMAGALHVKKANIPMNAVILVVFLALEIILGGDSFLSITGIGIIIEIVATTLLAAGE